MHYAAARWEQEQKETLYRAYLTDALKVIAENTAKYAGGTFLSRRYVDFLSGKPTDERSGEEIAADVIKKAGLVVTE